MHACSERELRLRAAPSSLTAGNVTRGFVELFGRVFRGSLAEICGAILGINLSFAEICGEF